MDVSPQSELRAFIAKFEPPNQRLIRAVRVSLRRLFPAANELVYDNYNFFVIGYSATLRPSDAVMSIAASSKGVSICFMHGRLLADPSRLLVGAGKQTRFLRVDSAADLEQPAVKSLLMEAARTAKVALGKGPPGKLIIRSVSGKQRPRRTATKKTRK